MLRRLKSAGESINAITLLVTDLECRA